MKPGIVLKKTLAVGLCLAMILGTTGSVAGTELSVETPAEVVSIQEEPVPQAGDETPILDAPLEETVAGEEPAPLETTTSEAPSTEIPSTQTISTEEVPTEEVSTEVISTESSSEGSAEVSTETNAQEVANTESTEVLTTEVSTEIATEEIVEADTEVEAEEIVRFHYASDVVDVVVTLKDEKDIPANAKLLVNPVQITEDLQASLEEAAIQKKQSIDQAAAFDIRFEVDGQEVEPGDTVSVMVTVPSVVDKGTDASVYHVSDDVQSVTDMSAAVTDTGAVAFDTNHFSTYVIVNNGSSIVTVTLQHYYTKNGVGTPLYKEDVRQLAVGSFISDYKKAVNWSVQKVVEVTSNGGAEVETLISTPDQIQVASNKIIRVYYTSSTVITSAGQATFYDYVVKPVRSNGKDNPTASINTSTNYNSAIPYQNNWLTVGTYSQNYTQNQRNAIIGTANANQYYDNGIYHNNPVTGIVTGLSEDYKDVLFSVNEPGLFSSSAKVGKTILSDYSLQFQQTGDTYTLSSVLDPSNKTVATAGAGFFPLDNANSNVTDNGYGNAHNYYFGMRYDVTFTLGDYVGPLNYNFTGDDDLWVILDGKTVVLDIGGIHRALSGSANLWTTLGFAEGTGATTTEDKNKEHRLTILYMERGGNESNCNMNFILPNAKFIDVENSTASLTFDKVDKNNEPLKGAAFKLVNDADANNVSIAESDENGRVVFNGLAVGNYKLTETAAPDGYLNSDYVWKVKVVLEGENQVTATLYKEDGTTPITQIINYTEIEIIENQVEFNKSVNLTNWEDRTYSIDLTASAIGDVTETEGGPVDVVLLLDKSEKVGYELDYIKDAAKLFVENLSKSSPNSDIAIVSYAKKDEINFSFQQITSNPDGALTAIDALSVETIPNGQESSPNQAMITANQIVKDSAPAHDAHKKYVILFTATNQSQVNAQATTMKGNGITIFTVSYNTSDATQEVLEKVATEDCNFEALSAEELLAIFANIHTTITRYPNLTGVTIQDTIDARFEITEEEKARLESETGGFATVTRNNDGTTTVKWSDQTVGNIHVQDVEVGWRQTIAVVAKDDFIGGNNIPTNISGNTFSFIKVNGSSLALQQPKVNVKAAFVVNNAENTIFLGETISTTDEVLSKLFDQGMVKALNSTKFIGYEQELNQFALSWYTDESLTTEIDITDIGNQRPKTSEDPVRYYLKVTFDAGASTEESTANSANNIAGGINHLVVGVNSSDLELDAPRNFGVYTTHIVDGVIKITKEINTNNYYNQYQGDPIFTFKVKNQTTGKTFYRTLRFTETVADSNSTLYATIEGLEKGIYKIEELSTIRYSLSGIQAESDNDSLITLDTSGQSISVGIGDVKTQDPVTVLKTKESYYKFAHVLFTNVKNEQSRELTDTDTVKNRFVFGQKLAKNENADNQ